MDWVTQYQGLIGSVVGGLFTLLAGLFIFIDGKRQIRLQKSFRAEENERRRALSISALLGLRNYLYFMSEKHMESEALREDYFESVGKVKDIQPPQAETGFRALNLHLNQVSGDPSLHQIAFELYNLIRNIEIYEAEFDEFVSLFKRFEASLSQGISELFPNDERGKQLEAIDQSTSSAGVNVARSYEKLIAMIDEWLSSVGGLEENAGYLSAPNAMAELVDERRSEE